ncbi:MAG: hypothetical protein SYR96_31455, partial [Actinomycetota bacterium]|nr:hypothetical protein [Actinomycetota bacterium]
GAVAAGVLALPAAADRIAASVVEHRLASRLQCAAGLETAPMITCFLGTVSSEPGRDAGRMRGR